MHAFGDPFPHFHKKNDVIATKLLLPLCSLYGMLLESLTSDDDLYWRSFVCMTNGVGKVDSIAFIAQKLRFFETIKKKSFCIALLRL